jgi:hypothetical protein
MSGGVADFGQSSAASKRMADKRVPAVVNRQRLEPGSAEDLHAVRNRLRSV